MARFKYWVTHATFLGIVVHEAAHAICCWLYDIPIEEIVWYDPTIPGGYVRHYLPGRFTPVLVVTTAPLLVNTVLGVSLLAAITMSVVDAAGALPSLPILVGSVFGGWLSISALYHAFPSREDARTLWQHTFELPRVSLLYLPIVPLVFPVVSTILLLDLSRRFWGDAIYTVLITIATVYLTLNPEYVTRTITLVLDGGPPAGGF